MPKMWRPLCRAPPLTPEESSPLACGVWWEPQSRPSSSPVSGPQRLYHRCCRRAGRQHLGTCRSRSVPQHWRGGQDRTGCSSRTEGEAGAPGVLAGCNHLAWGFKVPNTGAYPSSPSPLAAPGAWSFPLSLISPLPQEGPGGMAWDQPGLSSRLRRPLAMEVPRCLVSVCLGDSDLGVGRPCLCPVTWGGVCGKPDAHMAVGGGVAGGWG